MPTRRQCANAIRALAMDAIESAKSGHPGAPLGMADMAEALWRHHLVHNPSNPQWPDRDRVVLSNGHASMLLYSVVHLSGYDLGIEDIKHFRQLHSRTPGHPEYHESMGVECTTGPLGQGLGMAVGMALAERMLAAQFNTPKHTIVDHHTYAFVGDGCLMEGVSYEACSLAGTLALGKLIVLYDANGISIDGHIDGWFDEDIAARFRACHWHVLKDIDGHDAHALDAALKKARATKNKPSIIICRTHIGFGSPNKAGSHDCHGAPLGPVEIAATRKALDWPHAAFEIPQNIYTAWDARAKGIQAQAAWQKRFDAYAAAYPDRAAEFLRRIDGRLPDNFASICAAIIDDAHTAAAGPATRVASNNVLNALIAHMPELVGGSADLSGSVGTMTRLSTPVSRGHYGGNYINYGVREFAMGTILNGLALHGGFVPYAGTFMIFSDYAKNALRLAALMQTKVLWVLTHDSIGVGEDGPTHQPVEHIPGLRLMPGLRLWRPCDSVETAVAWHNALTHSGPTVLALSRQNVPFVPRDAVQIGHIARGAYVLRDCATASSTPPEVILIATGSEVALALSAADALTAQGRRVRVVSMPCAELFDAQDAAYRESVLPLSVRRRVAVEAASADYWRKYVGLDGRVVGMSSFGASAPGPQLAAHFGFTVDHVIHTVKELL